MTHSDRLIYIKHAFDINITIKETQRQYIMWKPKREKPQRCSSSGMRIGFAPLVCALNLQTLLWIFFTIHTSFSCLILSSLSFSLFLALLFLYEWMLMINPHKTWVDAFIIFSAFTLLDFNRRQTLNCHSTGWISILIHLVTSKNRNYQPELQSCFITKCKFLV